MPGTDELLKMIQGAVDATTITNVDRLKVAACGLRKVGKSNLIARTARKPLLHYDFDDRASSIAGLEGVIIKTLVDRNTNTPTAWNILESDIGSLRYLKQKGELGVKSICLDSMTFARMYAENQMMKDTNLKRTRIINGQLINIAQGWDAVTAVKKMFYAVLNDLFSLDIDIYCIFHIIPEKDKVNTQRTVNEAGIMTEVAAYTGRYVVEPQYMEEILSTFNEVWRIYIDAGGQFRMQVKPDQYFQAASALHNLDQDENQDIAALLRKHGV